VIGMKQEEKVTITFSKKKLEWFLNGLIDFPFFLSICIAWVLECTEIIEEHQVDMKFFFGGFTFLLLAFYGMLVWFLKKYYSTKNLWGSMVVSLIFVINNYHIFIVPDIFW
jgi:hypothetical protein